MDGTRELLEAIRDNGLASGRFRGVLHIAIGRKLTRPDGAVVSTGVTWRELAALLKLLRFDKELVRELGADPEGLAPRDRQRFWYSAIALGKVDSPEAVAEAERLVGPLKELGFVVGPLPGSAPPPASKKKDAAREKPEPKKRKKKE